MYRKKRRNKRSDAHDMMDITFKSVVHALRLSSIKIPKNVLLPSQLPAHVNSSEEEDVHGNEEEDVHDREEEHAHDSEEDVCGREQDHWNVNEDKADQVHNDSRSPMLDTMDKLTEPTACSLLDGTRINVELALAKVFPF
jgi:cobalamin biosynthesis protein CobT